MSPTRLNLAVLDCDIPVPNVLAKLGLYSDIFENLLRDAAATLPRRPKLKLGFGRYDCVKGELPSFEELKNIDGLIITGSGKASHFHISESSLENVYYIDIY